MSDAFVNEIEPLTTKVSKNKFGCLVDESIFPYPYVEKTIKAPLVPYHMDYVQQEAHLKASTQRHKELLANGPAPIVTCEDRQPDMGPTDDGMLLPVFAAQINAENPKATYKGRCFEEITFTYEKTSESTFVVDVTTAKPKSTMCKDVILFANTEI